MNPTDYETIQIKTEGSVAEIIFNRPQYHNSLNMKLVEELGLEFDRIEREKDIRFVVFKGAGSKAFCSGADLKEKKSYTFEQNQEFLDKLNAFINRIEDSRFICFSAIDGFALGGGLEINLACDFRIATEKSIFGQPEVRIGLIPGAGGTQRLVNICGVSNAKIIAMMGQRFDAKTALKYNIITDLVKDEKGMDEHINYLRTEISKSAPIALSSLKKAINASWKSKRKDLLRNERACYNTCYNTNDRSEGLRAFEAKRKPEYKGE